MALVVGTIYSSTGSSTGRTYLTAGIDYTLVSQSISGNTSKIRVAEWMRTSQSDTAYNYNDQTATCRVGSTTKTAVTDFDMRQATVNAKSYITGSLPFRRISGTMVLVDGKYWFEFDVPHNADGTMTGLNIYCEIPSKAGSNGLTSTVNIYVDLPYIARLPKCTLNSFAVGGTAVASLTETHSSLGYILKWYVAGELVWSERGALGFSIPTSSSQWKNTLYSLCTNAKEMNSYIKAEVYTDKTYTTKIGESVSTTQKITINETECLPVFNDFDYEDVNATTLALTGNSQKILLNRSSVKCTIPITKKAVGKYYASITQYTFQNGTKKSYSETASVSETIGTISDSTISIVALDSRKLTTTAYKSVDVINYASPSLSEFKSDRNNGIEESATISLTAKYWKADFGKGFNTITNAKYRVKKKSDTAYSSWFDITTRFKNAMVENVGSNNISTFTIKDLSIYSNGISAGFQTGVQYSVELEFSDGISSTFNSISAIATLQDGKFLDVVYKDANGDYHMGINGMPDDNYTLLIHGRTKTSGLLEFATGLSAQVDNEIIPIIEIVDE